MGFLATEARRQGVPEEGGVRVDIGLSMEQMALLVGATRQTVSTLLNDLIRSGLVTKIERGQYLIPAVEALEAAVDKSS